MQFLIYTALLSCVSSSLAWRLDNHPPPLTRREHAKDFTTTLKTRAIDGLTSSTKRRWTCDPYHNPKGACEGNGEDKDTDSKPKHQQTTKKQNINTPRKGTDPPVAEDDSEGGARGGKRFKPVPKLEKGRRGVNLGSYLLFEPWISQDEWDNTLGCKGAQSEYDCGKQLGQEGVNAAFEKHWQTFYTKQDVTDMKKAGINTIRVPVGHWVYKATVNDDEIFPENGFKYLRQVCQWATDEGLYIIMDHHGAPGSQVPANADTGHYVPDDKWGPGNFFSPENYERGLKFLEWITTQIHTLPEFANVGAIQVINEPVQNSDKDERTKQWTDSMRRDFYPAAYKRIRKAEQAAGIADANTGLRIMYMNTGWWSGDPKEYLPSDASNLLFDDHRYIKWANDQGQDHDSYMRTSCNDDRSGDGDVITGEWSLSAPLTGGDDPYWNPSSNKDWYLGWFAAQARSYEKQYGWVFWSWKMVGDSRWSFKDAIADGLIPRDLDSIYSEDLVNKCAQFSGGGGDGN